MYIHILYIHTVWVCLKTPISLMWFVIDCVYHKTLPEAIRATCHWTLDLRFAYLPWCPLAKRKTITRICFSLVGFGFGWFDLDGDFPINQPALKRWTWNLGVCGSLILRPGNLWRSHWERNFVETVQSCKAEYLQGHFEDVTLRLTSTHWIYAQNGFNDLQPRGDVLQCRHSKADGFRSHFRTSPANSQSKTSIHPPAVQQMVIYDSMTEILQRLINALPSLSPAQSSQELRWNAVATWNILDI